GRVLVFNLAGQFTAGDLLHLSRAAQGAHRCIYRELQQQCRAIRVDQVQSSSAPCQRAPYQRIVTRGTSRPSSVLAFVYRSRAMLPDSEALRRSAARSPRDADMRASSEVTLYATAAMPRAPNTMPRIGAQDAKDWND